MLKIVSTPFIALTLANAAFAESTRVTEIDYWQPYDGAEIRFDVLRKGKPFGEHVVRFAVNEDGDFTAETDVDLQVKIGPFTAFRYELDSTETWRNGMLTALSGRTNDDGDTSTVKASLQGAKIMVDGTAFDGKVDAGIIPSSHWNIEQVRAGQMLSTEDGEIIKMQVVPRGREMLTIAGQTIEAERYLLDSDVDVDLWYDDQGRWLKLAFEVRGQDIEYKLKDLY